MGPTLPTLPDFLLCSYFSLLFLENALLSLVFTLKNHLQDKNTECYKLSIIFLQGADRRNLNFEI